MLQPARVPVVTILTPRMVTAAEITTNVNTITEDALTFASTLRAHTLATVPGVTTWETMGSLASISTSVQ